MFPLSCRFDTPSQISDASIQRAGENVAALVKEVANSSLLPDPGEDKHGKLIFFDFLGLFSVVYPERLAVVVNSFFVLISVAAVYFGVARGRGGTSDGEISHTIICPSVRPFVHPPIHPSS